MSVNRHALQSRKLPSKISASPVPLYIVDTQKDIYSLYRRMGLHGARIIHLNQYFNLAQYEPVEFQRSEPFPLSSENLGVTFYEKGIDSHNWLYIASRVGMVRAVVTVLPDSVFRLRSQDLKESSDYSYRPPLFTGYTFDIQRTVTSINGLPRINEPVIINIDAGYFIDNNEPAEIILALKSACQDIRGIVLVRSLDEPKITPGMTERLEKTMQLLEGRT